MKKTTFFAMAFVAAMIATISFSSCKQTPNVTDKDTVDTLVKDSVTDTLATDTVDTTMVDSLVGPEA